MSEQQHLEIEDAVAVGSKAFSANADAAAMKQAFNQIEMK